MKDTFKDNAFVLGKKSTNFIKIIAGAAAGALTYGIIHKISTRAHEKVDDNYHLTSFWNNSNSLAVTEWISPEARKEYGAAIENSREIVKRFKSETGAPGMVVGVSIDRKVIWKEGFGYSNLETGSLCNIATVMRIASISKPITMAVLAKMWENGEVDIDKPINLYLSYFPSKQVDGESVVITARQLASHTAGIRHYTKKGEKPHETDSTAAEFYIKERFHNVQKSVDLFKDDELLFRPGTSFNYTTHGYTLLSAVMEGVMKKPFNDIMKDFFNAFGMQETHLDEVSRIIYNRASYYTKNKKGRIINAELADTSYKWAGGGIVSTVGDLLKFGNAMLYCYQQTEADTSGYLKKETVKEMWTPVKHSKMTWGKDAGYGLGWIVVPGREEAGGLLDHEFYIGHGGGAVGASSVLIIIPGKRLNSKRPNGIVVAVLANLQDISCHGVAKKIAQEFS